MDEQWATTGQQPSLSLGLTVGAVPMRRAAAPAATTRVLVEEDFMSVKKGNHEVEALEAELRRVGEENRRLGEMLRALVHKYADLQAKVTAMAAAAAVQAEANNNNHQQSSTTASEEGGGSAASPSRNKRVRSDDGSGAGAGFVTVAAVADHTECTSAAAAVKVNSGSKVSRRFVHADPADLSLVSTEIPHNKQSVEHLACSHPSIHHLLLPRDHRWLIT